MKRAVIIIPLLFFIVILGMFLHTGSLFNIFIKCKTLSVDAPCVVATVENTVETNPFLGASYLKDLAFLRRMALVGGDYRVYSVPLHRLGYEYYKKEIPFESLDENCPKVIKDGCVHGYVMEYIHNSNKEAGMSLCTTTTNKRLRLGCIHALGHSYIENTNVSLEEAVKGFCQNAFQEIDFYACASGIFHEYTKGGENQGHHGYYDKPRKYNDLDCTPFSGRVYDLCFASIGSFHYYYDRSVVNDTRALCTQAQTVSAKESCLRSIDERRRISRGVGVIPQ